MLSNWQWRFGALLVIVVVLLELSTAKAETCCAKCIDQSDPSTTVITYDPLVFDQCSAAKGICCYGCSFPYGSLDYQDGITIDDNGTAQASAGQQFTFTLNNVIRVTYEFLRVNQAQTNFVSNGTTEVSSSDDDKGFSICVDDPGTVIFRGWGADECTQATIQFSITVSKSNSTSSCDSSTEAGSAISAASASSTTNQPLDSTARGTTSSTISDGSDYTNCNPIRGTVVTEADGSKTCTCTGDWRNPPTCDDFSYLKIVLTILGALATVISILLSVRAYVHSRREKKSKDSAGNDDQGEGDDDDNAALSVQVIHIGGEAPLCVSGLGDKLPPGTPRSHIRRSSFSGSEA